MDIKTVPAALAKPHWGDDTLPTWPGIGAISLLQRKHFNILRKTTEHNFWHPHGRASQGHCRFKAALVKGPLACRRTCIGYLPFLLCNSRKPRRLLPNDGMCASRKRSLYTFLPGYYTTVVGGVTIR